MNGTVLFSHGKESGPWGSKITAMAEVPRAMGFAVVSVDYRGIDDPAARVAKLIAAAGAAAQPRILVGSSMGGHVSAAAASRVGARGVFLLAPAFHMPGFEAETPTGLTCPASLVHGWRDDIVPVEHSIRWAREERAVLHIFESGHRLDDQIGPICELLGAFLKDFR